MPHVVSGIPCKIQGDRTCTQQTVKRLSWFQAQLLPGKPPDVLSLASLYLFHVFCTDKRKECESWEQQRNLAEQINVARISVLLPEKTNAVLQLETRRTAVVNETPSAHNACDFDLWEGFGKTMAWCLR